MKSAGEKKRVGEGERKRIERRTENKGNSKGKGEREGERRA